MEEFTQSVCFRAILKCWLVFGLSTLDLPIIFAFQLLKASHKQFRKFLGQTPPVIAFGLGFGV